MNVSKYIGKYNLTAEENTVVKLYLNMNMYYELCMFLSDHVGNQNENTSEVVDHLFNLHNTDLMTISAGKSTKHQNHAPNAKLEKRKEIPTIVRKILEKILNRKFDKNIIDQNLRNGANDRKKYVKEYAERLRRRNRHNSHNSHNRR